MIDKIIKLITKQKTVFILSSIYIVLAITNLTLLPISNDEGIYLDWGIRSTTTPGYLYYSLADGKPPLLIWMFGIFQQIIPDPLFAGRVVSVFLGLITMIGIYRIGNSFFNKRVALFSSILYFLTPIIFFYNRQALMEAGVGAAGVWATYFYLNLLKNRTKGSAIKAGVLSGIGFFIKTNGLIFLAVFILFSILKALKSKNILYIKLLGIIIISFCATISLLLISPQFWGSLQLNSRYGFSLNELVSFPISVWWKTLIANSSIFVVFVTPFITILIVWGVLLILRKNRTFTFLALLPVAFEILLIKAPSQRYLVSYLPLLLIFGGYALSKLEKQRKYLGVGVLIISLVIPIYFIYLQVFVPQQYFYTTKPLTVTTEYGYVAGQLSGYGVKKLLPELEKLYSKEVIYVLLASNAGNPESALNVYLENNRNVKLSYIESKYFGEELSKYDCIKDVENHPMYFISRSSYLVGLEKFLILEKKISLPETDQFIGIYKVKDECTNEKTMIIKPVFSD